MTIIKEKKTEIAASPTSLPHILCSEADRQKLARDRNEEI